MSRVVFRGRVLSAVELADLRQQIGGCVESIDVIDSEIRDLVHRAFPDLVAKLPPEKPFDPNEDGPVASTRLADGDFDPPGPNDHHVPGVVYDAIQRCAFVPTREGQMRAEIGDDIVRFDSGALEVERMERKPPAPSIKRAHKRRATQ